MILKNIVSSVYEDKVLSQEGRYFLHVDYVDMRKFFSVGGQLCAKGERTCVDGEKMFNFDPFRDAIIDYQAKFDPDPMGFVDYDYSTEEYTWKTKTNRTAPKAALTLNKRKLLMDRTESISLSQKYRDAAYRHYAPSSAVPSREHLGLEPLMEDLSFAMELEMSTKKTPLTVLLRKGMIPLYDGSIRGHEVCTHPLSDAEGLALINNAIKTLHSAGEQTDSSCSYHIHIAPTIELTKKQVVALYLLYWKIYGGLIEIFPYYLTDPVGIGGKNKNFCEGPIKPFTTVRKMDIEEMYKIVRALYVGSRALRGPSYNNPARYAAINMYPFFALGGTIEFRMHPGTLSSLRGLGWMAFHGALFQMVFSDADMIIDSIVRGHKTSVFDVLEFARGLCANGDGSTLLQLYEDQLETDMSERSRIYTESIDIAGDGGTSRRNSLIMQMSADYFKNNPQI